MLLLRYITAVLMEVFAFFVCVQPMHGWTLPIATLGFKHQAAQNAANIERCKRSEDQI